MKENNKINIRYSDISDTLFIKNLSTKAFKPFGEYGEVVSNWHESENSVTLIACSRDQPLGFAMISKPFSRYYQNNSTELLAIAIEPDWQGKGAGKALLAELEKKALNMGITLIFLHTAVDNINARKLFSDSGFRIWQIKRNFYPEGQDACVMAKNLLYP